MALLVGLVQASAATAYRDPLTGIPGRRALDEALASLAGRYTLAVVDVDHFKKFNDTHGHDVGDQVLRMVAARLAAVGGGGRAFRHGGEEFALLFPGKAMDACVPHLEAVRKGIAGADFTLRAPDRPRRRPKEPASRAKDAPRLTLTVSIGAAERGATLRKVEEVLRAADTALYRAKQGGRNRVAT
jgi:diguanylate cyclase (GGDEF)-like protein